MIWALIVPACPLCWDIKLPGFDIRLKWASFHLLWVEGGKITYKDIHMDLTRHVIFREKT